jgi:uncharacterized protein (DUF952 family)
LAGGNRRESGKSARSPACRPSTRFCPAADWEAATRTGIFQGSPVDLRDGYIHLSTAEQIAETAARHFAGQNDLVLVAVDAAVLGDKLKWEPSRGGALFPHLYADLPVNAALWIKPLPLDETGRHVFPTEASDPNQRQ